MKKESLLLFLEPFSILLCQDDCCKSLVSTRPGFSQCIYMHRVFLHIHGTTVYILYCLLKQKIKQN